MKRLRLILLLFISCVILCSCQISKSGSAPMPTVTPIVIDYTTFMSENLIEALNYFTMPRAEFEALAFPTYDSRYVSYEKYNLGEISFLGYEGLAIAAWGSGENSETLWFIDIITSLTGDEMENIKNQLEQVLYTKCRADRYEDGKQYLFNIDIPNSNYWIHAENSYERPGMLELGIRYKDDDTATKTTMTSSYSTKNTARHTDSEAWVCAKKIVKDNLKSPSTAKFCSFTECKVTHLGDGEYMVTGWVEAQNSFGAILRQNFIVTYTATEQGFKNGIAIID